jgi:rRNA maturation endonuclease Nob1
MKPDGCLGIRSSDVAYEVQMLDANECRQEAMKCVKQAAEATDPILRQRLSETAQGWSRLAADLANLEDKQAKDQQDAA